MFHALIGLVIATILLIGWFAGNLFCCVFLSLIPAAGVLICALQHIGNGSPSPPAVPLLCILLLGIIWTPYYSRRNMQRAFSPRR